MEGYRPNGGGSIFIVQKGTPLKKYSIYYYWNRKLHSLGFKRPQDKGKRIGKNPHEIRDLFRTRWEKSPASGSVSEFMMGHIIDPLEYNKAMRDQAYTLQEFIRAEPWLNIITQDPTKVPKIEVEEMRVYYDRAIEELTNTVAKLSLMVLEHK